MSQSFSEEIDPLSRRFGFFSLHCLMEAADDTLDFAWAMESVARLLDDEFEMDVPQSVTIKCVDDATIQAYNKEYRAKDKPTNVLSFPDGSVEEDGVYLGDLIISFETLQREAVEQQKEPLHHVTHLLLHGVLHLLGYDHETEAEAEEMESLEITLLQQTNIPNPYEEKDINTHG